MKEKTVFAGFGGQGIISLGQIWVYCGMKEGKEVSFFPFYGAEKRGGIARASCIIADDTIASPIISSADTVVVMNNDSLPLCEELLKAGGLMLINSSLVTSAPERQDMRVVRVDATGMADKLGNAKAANMVMLGAAARLTGALSLADVEPILGSFFTGSKSSLLPLNLAAIRAGMAAVENVR